MTQKEIIMLASDPDLMALMNEIAHEDRNLCHKTIHEQRTARKRMQNLAADISDTLKARAKQARRPVPKPPKRKEPEKVWMDISAD